MFILILALIFALLISIFALQNAALVPIQIFWFTKNVPLVLIIFGSAFFGALIMLLLAFGRGLILKHKARLNNQQLSKDLQPHLQRTTSTISDEASEKNSSEN
jgi:uncharacterized integral membrane protein